MGNNTTVEVHFSVTLPDKLLSQLLNRAEEEGQGYGDPGKKELIKRLLVDHAIEPILDLDPTFNDFLRLG